MPAMLTSGWEKVSGVTSMLICSVDTCWWPHVEEKEDEEVISDPDLATTSPHPPIMDGDPMLVVRDAADE